MVFNFRGLNVNLLTAINIHNRKTTVTYWEIKFEFYDIVEVVGGAWRSYEKGWYEGGICGWFKNKTEKIIYAFSGPIHANDSEEVEREHIRNLIQISKGNDLQLKKIIIYSDSSNAINFILSDVPNQTRYKDLIAGSASMRDCVYVMFLGS